MLMRPTFNYTGVIPILATPFNDDESLDLDSLARIVEFNASVGVDGVTVLGLLGESNRLTDEERTDIVGCAVEAAGSLPVIVGTSHTGTAATIALSDQALQLGATAVMITPSAQPVPSDKAVIEYFERIAREFPGAIVLQDHPAISQVHMSVDLILRLVREIPTIVAIKAEALPSPARIGALKKGMAEGRRVPVLTGLGGLYGLFDLERGSDGFNTGFAFPEVLIAIVRAHRDGDEEMARALYERYLPLIVFEQQPGVAIRKEILRRRGLLRSNRVRHPGATIDPMAAAQLERLLNATFDGAPIDAQLMVTAG
ncbi:MAG TPA: dihydrodipicolinate synthase family protein [Gemmatimonadaceae bacterium]|nr:dihydrodipicolinate synthase family protein [Gemmatimonadaceae bacterium]